MHSKYYITESDLFGVEFFEVTNWQEDHEFLTLETVSSKTIREPVFNFGNRSYFKIHQTQPLTKVDVKFYKEKVNG